MPAITPFRVGIPQADLDDLHGRLDRVRWPGELPGVGWDLGIPLERMQELTTYWREKFDWRAHEAALNQYPQYTTEIDGQNIHFLHVRSANPRALPLILTHGWPGSVIEFGKVIGPLSDPAAYGDDAGGSFHVVCPSLPGYGFSGKPSKTGWGVGKIAEAWETLMLSLGYDRYGAQGGDWGAAVSTQIGRNRGHCIAIHLNMPIARPAAGSGGDLTVDEQQALAAYAEHRQWGTGYSKQQSTRPQTLGYGLVDSPVGQLAWIVEKFWAWTDCDGHPENAVSRDELLDNVMLYWITGSGASSARLYWESFNSFITDGRVELPTGVAAFPKEILRTPRRWCEAVYNITHWTTMPRGGHFAAFEQPDLFVDDVRAFFATVR